MTSATGIYTTHTTEGHAAWQDGRMLLIEGTETGLQAELRNLGVELDGCYCIVAHLDGTTIKTWDAVR